MLYLKAAALMVLLLQVIQVVGGPLLIGEERDKYSYAKWIFTLVIAALTIPVAYFVLKYA